MTGSTAARPQVDVLVVTFETASVTPTALRSLLDSDQGADIRILVHDNASTDGTAEQIAARVPEAELHAGSGNIGFAAAVNRLVERSTAPWVLLLNPDAWPEPHAIGALVEAARQWPRAAVVAPRLIEPDRRVQASTSPFPSIRIAFLYALGATRVLPRRVQDRLLVQPGWRHDRSRRVDWAIAAAWLMPRAAIDEVGRLDEGYFLYAEDVEWCWRATRAGWEIRFEPSVSFTHIGNLSGRQVRDDRRRAAAHLTNSYRFYASVHGRSSTVAFRALNACAALRLAVLNAVRGRSHLARFWWSQLPIHLGRSAEARP